MGWVFSSSRVMIGEGLNKGFWIVEEDFIFIVFVRVNGEGNWCILLKCVGMDLGLYLE